MKKWSLMFLVSIVLFGGYAMAPVESHEMVQGTQVHLDEDDLPYCH
ncbi:hypothetical protein [Guptibacillus algicola]|nr:hypothetical protein [Alkalihalobacillus algicola]MCA0988174.1 hypothetical protein [Alkalihalobacillus algicola]